MFSKLKYILFDFSDDFKNDFLNTLKKSAAFLVVGIIALFLSEILEPASIIAGGCILIFGFIWGRSLISSLAIFGSISNNFIIRLFMVVIIYGISIAFGYIYFLWCFIKFIICLIKQSKKD